MSPTSHPEALPQMPPTQADTVTLYMAKGWALWANTGDVVGLYRETQSGCERLDVWPNGRLVSL